MTCGGFPFIDKHALRDRQLTVPPLGDLVAVPEREVVYLSASSGSTGVPTASPFTARERQGRRPAGGQPAAGNAQGQAR